MLMIIPSEFAREGFVRDDNVVVIIEKLLDDDVGMDGAVAPCGEI